VCFDEYQDIELSDSIRSRALVDIFRSFMLWLNVTLQIEVS